MNIIIAIHHVVVVGVYSNASDCPHDTNRGKEPDEKNRIPHHRSHRLIQTRGGRLNFAAPILF